MRMIQPHHMSSLHAPIIPHINMRSFGTLSRSDYILFLFDTKTSNLSLVLAVDFLLIGGLLINDHFIANDVENYWALEGEQRELDGGELDAVDPGEVGVGG